MTGTFGLKSGIISLKPLKCRKCGKQFYGKDEYYCEDCWIEENRVIVGNCLIENCEGRCQEYLEGKCNLCLNITSDLDWEGWKRVKYVCKNKH
jgi:ribosomal protein L37E